MQLSWLISVILCFIVVLGNSGSAYVHGQSHVGPSRHRRSLKKHILQSFEQGDPISESGHRTNERALQAEGDFGNDMFLESATQSSSDATSLLPNRTDDSQDEGTSEVQSPAFDDPQKVDSTDPSDANEKNMAPLLPSSDSANSDLSPVVSDLNETNDWWNYHAPSSPIFQWKTPPPPQPQSQQPGSTNGWDRLPKSTKVIILVGGVAILAAILFFFILGLRRCCVLRGSHIRTFAGAAKGKIEIKGAPFSTTLPDIVEGQQRDCEICCEQFQRAVDFTTFHCGHTTCKLCYSKILSKKQKACLCPFCRVPLRKDPKNASSDGRIPSGEAQPPVAQHGGVAVQDETTERNVGDNCSEFFDVSLEDPLELELVDVDRRGSTASNV